MRPPTKRKPKNVLDKVFMREISAKANQSFKKNNLRERFQGFSTKVTFDPIHNLSVEKEMLASAFANRRSRIVEIVSAGSFVFALTHSGLCAAYDRDKNSRLCFLNISPDEVIRSLFYNKQNNSLITVSVYRTDNFCTLQCRTTHLEYIRKGTPENGYVLFESEMLKWPGFVEFDDVNGKVLTYSAINKLYKIWDLKNYTLLYSVKDDGIKEVKISPGVMLVIRERTRSHLPLTLLSIETGEVLHSYRHLLHRNKPISFVEQFNDLLIIKQEGETLQIVEIEKKRLTQVQDTESVSPAAFVFLYDHNMFLTCLDRGITVWNVKGEAVNTFDSGSCPRRADLSSRNAFYITQSQDVMITYTKREESQPQLQQQQQQRNGNGNGSTSGFINVTDILSGKNVIQVNDERDSGDEVTALFYNEERNEIYIGDRSGFLSVWSN